MKRTRSLLSLLLFFAFSASGLPAADAPQKSAINRDAARTMARLLKTSPLLLDGERAGLLKTVQEYSEKLPHPVFRQYLKAGVDEAAAMERDNPILGWYRLAFDRVLDEVANTKVEQGTAVIWMLYNMGIVVKTPSGCFGVDINHKYAEKFEPLLDFLCVTHNHGDHKSVELMNAMRARGKPVLSNFYKNDAQYYSKEPAEYKIGAFSIRTDITDHNAKLLKFVTVYRLDCGKDSGGLSILHGGDSNFKPEQFERTQGPVGLFITRWGAPEENNLLDAKPGKGRIDPACTIFSHMIELRHDIEKSPRRRTLNFAMDNIPKMHCPRTIMPFWGEKMIWKNGKLQ
ncbi:hypothetical protein M2103_000333 [Ereboglobus sp. PH5-5]|uniref:hypothetical protein n=1 Tax=Ereboglobus sp. PH5-5 TaxID=2940529 RepID=UPI0024058A71|nr:hypothetical protein [Ereboglobus sp. PH5-5]MDF9832125.1 hypothetical protein [Ereboglobus sp. PH5-5]